MYHYLKIFFRPLNLNNKNIEKTVLSKVPFFRFFLLHIIRRVKGQHKHTSYNIDITVLCKEQLIFQ